MQDFTGVPAIVDLATMRDVIKKMGGDPKKIKPPAAGGSRHRSLRAGRSVRKCRRLCIQCRSRARAQSRALRFSQVGAKGLSELQRRCRRTSESFTRSTSSTLQRRSLSTQRTARKTAYPDTLVGTDSHTTMINGLGVVGWAWEVLKRRVQCSASRCPC